MQQGEILDMKSFRRVAHVMFAVLVAGASNAVAADQSKSKIQQDPKAETPVQQASKPVEYVIGPDDLLAVNVWKEPEISRNVPVRPDGKISLPLVGDLRADGRTPTQLQDEIRQKLLAYLSDPEVSVIVQEAK